MTSNEFEKLRDKDHIVLRKISEGLNDTQKITSETTLENHHVSYCLEKLEELGLIEVSQPEGMIERVINGQKRVFQHPKKAELTEKGERFLEQAKQEIPEAYEDLSHNELVEKVRQLEAEIGQLEQKFEVFRNQIQQKL